MPELVLAELAGPSYHRKRDPRPARRARLVSAAFLRRAASGGERDAPGVKAEAAAIRDRLLREHPELEWSGRADGREHHPS